MSLGSFGGWTLASSGAAALCGVAFMGCQGEEPVPATQTGTPTAVVVDAEPTATPVALASVEAPEGAVVFSVPDMHCAFACAPKVERTLTEIPGVEKVETDVEHRTATVFINDQFDQSVAVAALGKAGYPSQRISR